MHKFFYSPFSKHRQRTNYFVAVQFIFRDFVGASPSACPLWNRNEKKATIGAALHFRSDLSESPLIETA
jgi:hypothetical protein